MSYIIYHKQTGMIKTVTIPQQDIGLLLDHYQDHDAIPNTTIPTKNSHLYMTVYRVNTETKELERIYYGTS